MAFGESDFPKDEKYLREYEEKIRQLPYEELDDILSLIEMDPVRRDKSPERINIVKKRMAELEPMVRAAEEKKAEVHKRAVENYKKNRSGVGMILWLISLCLMVFPLIGLCAHEMELGISCVLIGIALVLFIVFEWLDKAAYGRGGTLYKEEHPVAYWASLIFQACAALVLLVSGVVGLLST